MAASSGSDGMPRACCKQCGARLNLCVSTPQWVLRRGLGGLAARNVVVEEVGRKLLVAELFGTGDRTEALLGKRGSHTLALHRHANGWAMCHSVEG